MIKLLALLVVILAVAVTGYPAVDQGLEGAPKAVPTAGQVGVPPKALEGGEGDGSDLSGAETFGFGYYPSYGYGRGYGYGYGGYGGGWGYGGYGGYRRGWGYGGYPRYYW